MSKVARFRDSLLQISGSTLILCCWEFIPKLGWIEAWYIPSFSTTLQEFFRLLNAGNLLIHLMVI